MGSLFAIFLLQHQLKNLQPQNKAIKQNKNTQTSLQPLGSLSRVLAFEAIKINLGPFSLCIVPSKKHYARFAQPEQLELTQSWSITGGLAPCFHPGVFTAGQRERERIHGFPSPQLVITRRESPIWTPYAPPLLPWTGWCCSKPGCHTTGGVASALMNRQGKTLFWNICSRGDSLKANTLCSELHDQICIYTIN